MRDVSGVDTAWVEKFLTSPGNDGRAFSGVVDVRRDGEVLFQSAFGLASPRWGVPNTLDMRFDVASISKLFTSVAVLQLVDAGRLDLDARRPSLPHEALHCILRSKDRHGIGKRPGNGQRPSGEGL